jgi:hypothetical protein
VQPHRGQKACFTSFRKQETRARNSQGRSLRSGVQSERVKSCFGSYGKSVVSAKNIRMCMSRRKRSKVSESDAEGAVVPVDHNSIISTKIGDTLSGKQSFSC